MTNMFWMTFEDVLQHFDSLYVNWNPALFTHRQDHHFTWTPPSDTEELVYTHNPQYTITSPTSDPVWILLSRHHQDAELDILRQRRNPSASLSAVSSQLGFTSLSLHTTTPPGTRVPLHERHRCLHQLPYVDSPNTLLRYTPTPSSPLTLVISQSSLPLPKYTFTLTILSTPPLTITPAPPPLPHNTTLHSSWTRRTAGGSTTHPSYLLNPQFTLSLPSPSPITLLLSTPLPDLPIHIAILHSPPGPAGGRITSLTRRALLGASPEYSRGRAFASVPLADAGTYTIVASTFEPGQTARFALRVSAACAVDVRPVPADAAGRLRTAAPRPAPAGAERVRARLEVGRLARVSLVVRSDATGCPAVRGALEVGTGPDRRVVAVTGEGGEFADAARGLRTEEVDVDPEDVRVRGGLWAVVEQLGSLSRTPRREGVSVEVLSDGVVRWGEWEVAEES